MKKLITYLVLALSSSVGIATAQTSSIQYLEDTTKKIQVIGNYKEPKLAVVDADEGEKLKSVDAADTATLTTAELPTIAPSAATLTMPELRLDEASLPVVQVNSEINTKR